MCINASRSLEKKAPFHPLGISDPKNEGRVLISARGQTIPYIQLSEPRVGRSPRRQNVASLPNIQQPPLGLSGCLCCAAKEKREPFSFLVSSLLGLELEDLILAMNRHGASPSAGVSHRQRCQCLPKGTTFRGRGWARLLLSLCGVSCK